MRPGQIPLPRDVGVKKVNKTQLVPVMNNSKWEELRLAMYSLDELHPQWRTKDVETDFVSNWDGEWFDHFRVGGYACIEWVDIRVTSAEQQTAVFDALRAIHVPGRQTDDGFRVFGYVQPGEQVDYIT